MKIVVGQRFRSRSPRTVWVVERLLSRPGIIEHVTMAREDSPCDTKTYSAKALEDLSFFEPVKDYK